MGEIARLIDISDLPNSGGNIKRKAKRGEYSDTKDQIYLQVYVEHYNSDGSKSQTRGIADFDRKLIAVNDTLVDKNTGDLASESTPESDRMGELDYLRTIKVPAPLANATLADINEFIYEIYIAKADARGQFDG